MAAAAAAVPGHDHVVVFPFMAKGHTLPLLHFAAALAARHGDDGGVRVTVVTTPANVAFARRRLPAPVRVAVLQFPEHQELPTGVESTDALPSQSLFPAFLRATALLRDSFAAYLASLPAPPLALVSDFFLGFTQRAADEAGVRRVTFHGMSAFSLALCFSLAMRPPTPESIQDGVPFLVPGFPEDVTITADEVPHAVSQAAVADDPVSRFMEDEVRDWDYRSWGVLVNSFAALDGDYAAILESFYLPGGARVVRRPAVPRRRRQDAGTTRRRRGPGSLPLVARRACGAAWICSVRVVRHAGRRHRRAARRARARARGVRPRLPLGRAVRRMGSAGGPRATGEDRPELGAAAARAGAPGGRRVPEPLRLELCAGEPRLRPADAGVARDGRAGREREARGGHHRRRRPRGCEGRRAHGHVRGQDARGQGAGGREGPGADARGRGGAADARQGRARPAGGA